VSVPGAFSGRLDVTGSLQFWGAEANIRCVATDVGWCRIEAIGGFRHLGVNEGLDIVQISQGLGGPFTTGAFGVLTGTPRFRVVDLFQTRNLFFGGQAGVSLILPWDPCWVALVGKVGVGVNDQLIRINGSTSFTQGGDGVDFIAPGARVPGGLLTSPSNIGDSRRGRVACMTEGGIDWGFQICSWLEFSLGYSFIWWSSVIRPGDQIDRRINLASVPLSPTYIPGTPPPALPTVPFIERDIWAQGLNLTMRFLF
jgi:hypothetical protein